MRNSLAAILGAIAVAELVSMAGLPLTASAQNLRSSECGPMSRWTGQVCIGPRGKAYCPSGMTMKGQTCVATAAAATPVIVTKTPVADVSARSVVACGPLSTWNGRTCIGPRGKAYCPTDMVMQGPTCVRPQSPVNTASATHGPPWVITTTQLTLVGGAMTSFAPFSPVTITTPALTLVGGTKVAFAPFQPVVVTTPALTLVGQ